MSAIDYRWIDTNVSLAKRRLLQIVARSAQRLNGFSDKAIFCRKMRLMAFLAIPGCRRMSLFFSHFFLQLLMTGQAEVRSLGKEKGLELCFVRAVALRAFAVDDGLMAAFPGFHPLFKV